MKNFATAALVMIFVASCGGEWADCPTCKPGEESAESVDGGAQIPVVVNVTVNVNVDQTQNQGQGQQQGQGQGQTNTNTNTNTNTTNNPLAVDAGTPPVVDAGTPPKPDAGSPKPDAGTPKPDAGTPKADAGCPPVCRQVCTCTETRYVCKTSHKDTNKRSDCSCGVEHTYSKCTKEVTQCS